jgi:3-oxoacyl-[acyl-carrier protein] reductase
MSTQANNPTHTQTPPQSTNQSFAGKVALVTGGSAIAKRLASQGAAVAITYANNSSSAEEVVNTIRVAGGNAIAI